MSLAMSAAEQQELLAGLHVGVLSVAAGERRGPLTVPVWYEYQPGGRLSVVTGQDVDPAERLAMARRYLGTEGGDQYVTSNPDPDGEMRVFRMTPERWVGLDFGKAPG